MSQYQFHINIIANRWQLEAVRFRSAAPGLAFLVAVIILVALKLQYNWYFIVVLTGQLVTFMMPFFPFYSNSTINISEEGIILQKKAAEARPIKWSEIEDITFADRGAPSDYGNHIETIIGLRGEEVRFGVYRYLFKSKRRITRELISAILKFPEAKTKLPGELVERYADT